MWNSGTGPSSTGPVTCSSCTTQKPIHVPCIHRVDESLNDLYGVHECIPIQHWGVHTALCSPAQWDRVKPDWRRNRWDCAPLGWLVRVKAGSVEHAPPVEG